MEKFGASLGFAALLAATVPVRGDVASEAGFFDAMARRNYQSGQYEKALESFQLVQEIAPSQRALYNTALCADLAERSDMAFSLYAEYLRSEDPDPTRRAEAMRRIDELKRKLALIEIATEPAQAAIYLDRKELGRFALTPATIAVADGEHRVLIERSDFAVREVSVVAKAGSITSVREVLEPLFGFVTVHTAPATAVLRFVRAGEPIATQVAPGRHRLAAGQYQVVAEASGYTAAQAALLVRKDDDVRLELGLVPLPRETGRLLVSTGKRTADVYVDGRRVAVTPATLTELGPGEHVVEVRAGTQTARRNVTVRAGHAVHVEIALAGDAR